MNMIDTILRYMPPEWAHRTAVWGLKNFSWTLSPPDRFTNLFYDPGLGRKMRSPIALAAGFDKDAKAILGGQKLGFGAVEVGSITPKPQPGNKRPRVFRLTEDQGIINRYGFNSKGADYALRQLGAIQSKKLTGPLGVNLGKNKNGDTLKDYCFGLQTFAPFADYLTLNLSSPNTPGLRDEQNLSAITSLLDALHPIWPNKPVLIKLAPDLADDDLIALIEIIASSKAHGVILGNTTISRPSSLVSASNNEIGGLSGVPLFELSLRKLKIAARVNRSLPSEKKLILIGCGGINNAINAMRMIRSGASVVQLYSAMIYHGPQLINRMNAELSAILDSDGIANIHDVIGVDIP